MKNHCKEKECLFFCCDNCGGQSKNKYIAIAIIYIFNTIEKVNVIDIRFPYKGHTFLPDVSNSGNMEKKVKAKELATVFS